MAKIITVTANTAIDMFIEVGSLTASDTILAKSSAEFACGKGINVAKAVESLAYPILCLGFVGRQSIDAFDSIRSDLLQTDLTAVAGKTRTNITLVDLDNAKETHIRTAGFTVTDHDCRRLIATIETHAEPGDIVIVSGSLPPGAPDDFYRILVHACRELGIRVFLDTSGPGLSKVIEAKPDLIKPNQHEFEDLIGRSLPDPRSIVDAAHSLIESGVGEVYVSRGANGCIAVTDSIAMSAYLNDEPKGIVTKIGCGDAMVAGLAVATLQESAADETLRLAVASGAANLFSKEPGRFARDRLEEIERRVIVEAIR